MVIGAKIILRIIMRLPQTNREIDEPSNFNYPPTLATLKESIVLQINAIS